MAGETEINNTKTSQNKKKHSEDMNFIIYELCLKTKAPTFTRTITQAIFQKSSISLTSVNSKKLAVTSFYLAAKITDIFDESEFLKLSSRESFDSNLELKICQILNFSFDFIDIYSIVKEICKIIHKEESLEQRLKNLDKVYSCDRINNFDIRYGSTDGSYLPLTVFKDDEIALFKTINCVEINRQLLENCRRTLNDLYVDL